MKQAIGLAVSGTEVRLAHLVFNKGRLRIEALERARLRTTLEFQPAEEKTADYAESKDAFGLKENTPETPNHQNALAKDSENLEILYGLLEKFSRKKMKVGFNIPLSMVNYRRPGSLVGTTQTSIERANAPDKETGPSWGHEQIKSKNGVMMNVAFERQPPTLTLLRDLRSYLRGSFHLAVMDTSEMALANLARSSMKLEGNRVTAIIYIEDDFTRLIFLRGDEMFHVSSMIHERATSPDILEVIYRKLLYEQDEVNIPDISCILLAGKGYRIDAKDFFAERFESAMISYLACDRFDRFPTNERERETFSEFAVAIALAWKVLQPKNPWFISLNLLPQELRDQQEVLKLSYHGYMLLAVTGVVAFFLTWQVLRIRSDIAGMRVKNAQLELQIKNNQSTVDRVMTLDDESQRLRKNLTLADSLSRGYDDFMSFLQKLNSSVRRSGSLWVDGILKQKDGFSINGTSMNRETIPVLAEKLGGANLRKVTRMEASSRKMFQFEMEHKTDPNNPQFSARDIRIIDVDKTSRNENPALSKEDHRRPASPSRGSEASLAAVGDNVVPPKAEQPARAVEEKPPDQATPSAKTKSRFTSEERTQRYEGERLATPERPANGAARSDNRSTGARPGASKANTESNLQEARLDLNLPGSADRLKIESKGEAETNRRETAPRVERFSGADHASASVAPPESPKGTPAPNSTTSNGSASAVTEQAQPQTAVATSVPRRSDRYRAYTIEAAVSYTRDLAEQAATVFRKKGLDVMVQDFEDERRDAKRYRVLVGIFATQAAAEAKAAQLAGLLMKDYRIIGL